MVFGGLSAGAGLFLWTLLDSDKILVTSAGGLFFGAIQALGLTLPGLLARRPRFAEPLAAAAGARWGWWSSARSGSTPS